MPGGGARFGVTALVLASLLAAVPDAAVAASSNPAGRAVSGRPYVGLIIDDLGNSLSEGERVLRLPGNVAAAILPHTAHSRALARAFRAAHREVLLHLPMQPLEGEAVAPGPGTLEVGMSTHELAHMLDYNLATVPHAIGVNNHMGSLLTQHAEAMRTLMQELRERRLFFVDSMTTPQSVAATVARSHRVPTLVRHVFLDNDREPRSIERQIDALIGLAHSRGHALGIGHPYPETLAALERRLPELARQGVELVPLASLLTLDDNGRSRWHASWSR
jgi:hypothetical protein